jgi:DNA methyltransferase 1-associated protein 1
MVNRNSRVRDCREQSLISVEYFGSFNLHGPSVMEYSQYEYDQHLGDSDWTAQETTYMFNLLREYDLRFIVVADRYRYQDTRTRTVEVSPKRPVKQLNGRKSKIAISQSAAA